VALRKRLGGEKPIFLDPADFRDRIPQFRELLRALRKRHLVDWVSMNQQESEAAADLLGIRTKDLGELCSALARNLGVVFDLHGERATYTSEGTRTTSVPVRRVRAERLIGAGDVWDAGAIYGRISGMDEENRLRFANMAAKVYLKIKVMVPPTAEQVQSALE
jgi:sugar/nucleoside kinase (ribokinase family)